MTEFTLLNTFDQSKSDYAFSILCIHFTSFIIIESLVSVFIFCCSGSIHVVTYPCVLHVGEMVCLSMQPEMGKALYVVFLSLKTNCCMFFKLCVCFHPAYCLSRKSPPLFVELNKDRTSLKRSYWSRFFNLTHNEGYKHLKFA